MPRNSPGSEKPDSTHFLHNFSTEQQEEQEIFGLQIRHSLAQTLALEATNLMMDITFLPYSPTVFASFSKGGSALQ